MKPLVRPLDTAKDEITRLRQVLRWIHDEATAPTVSLTVAESRLRVCARYAKGALRPNEQVRRDLAAPERTP